jgi:hypothetical protein
VGPKGASGRLIAPVDEHDGDKLDACLAFRAIAYFINTSLSEVQDGVYYHNRFSGLQSSDKTAEGVGFTSDGH